MQLSDGDACKTHGCPGNYVWKQPDECSCHLAPPCDACIAAPLVCDTCELEASEDDPDESG